MPYDLSATNPHPPSYILLNEFFGPQGHASRYHVLLVWRCVISVFYSFFLLMPFEFHSDNARAIMGGKHMFFYTRQPKKSPALN